MPTPFGDVDRSQTALMQGVVKDVTQKYVDNMSLKAQVQKDESDKAFASNVLNAYTAQLAPKKESVDRPDGTKEDKLKYPSDDEAYQAGIQARTLLLQSGGRHSLQAAEHIAKDLELRPKVLKTSASVSELQRYVDIYGEEKGLSMYSDALNARAATKAKSTADANAAAAQALLPAKTESQIKVEQEKGRQARMTEGVKVEGRKELATKVLPPKMDEKTGTIHVFGVNPFTNKQFDWDTGLKEIPKATGGSTSSKVNDALTNVAAFDVQMREYEKLLADVDSGRIGGTIAKGQAFVGWNDPARAAGGYQESLASTAARTINGERGVLTNQDVDRAKKMIPLITDTESERELKFKLLYKLLDERRKALTKGWDGGIHVKELDPPDYGDLNWDTEDSEAFLKENHHYPSYNEAKEALGKAK